MTESGSRPPADAQHVKDAHIDVYEAIATLEYAGRPATREQIAAATGLDGEQLDTALTALTGSGLLVRTDTGGQAGFAPADRGWSAAPGQTSRKL